MVNGVIRWVGFFVLLLVYTKAFPFLNRVDSIRSERVWHIYCDSIFPHEEYQDECGIEELVLKGFSVDEKGRFYVLGGEPVASIACYEGNRLVWKHNMESSFRHSANALLWTCADSICFFDEERFMLYAMAKDGKGEVARRHVVMEGNDTVLCGAVGADGIRLVVACRDSIVRDGCDLSVIATEYAVSNKGMTRRVGTVNVDTRDRGWNDFRITFCGRFPGGTLLRNAYEKEYGAFSVWDNQDNHRYEVRAFDGEPGLRALVTTYDENCVGFVLSANTAVLHGNDLYIAGCKLHEGYTFVVQKYHVPVLAALLNRGSLSSISWQKGALTE